MALRTKAAGGGRLGEVIRSVAKVAGFLWQKDWAEKNAGNISINVTGLIGAAAPKKKPSFKLKEPMPDLAGGCFLVSGTTKRMRDIADTPAENACVIGISKKGDGYKILWGGEADGFAPTMELPSHLRVQRLLLSKGGKNKAVLHTNPTELIALTHEPRFKDESALNEMLWAMNSEIKMIVPSGVGFIGYRLPGSRELAEATVRALDSRDIAMWEKHGCIAVGEGLEAAFDVIDAVNKAAQVYLMCKGAGYEPEGLTKKQVAELGRVFGAPRG